jgi:MarR family transcriptional regulator, temperature-dependent positive regulator of motility
MLPAARIPMLASAKYSGSERVKPQVRSIRSEVEDFDLTQHLPHLLRRTHFEAEAAFVQIYGEQVTSRQLALLVAVAQVPAASQSELAAHIGLDLNTCSDLVARTVAKGLLKRSRSEVNARVYRFRLTPTGHRVVTELAVPRAPDFVEAVAGKLSAAQRRQMIALLRRLLGLQTPASGD